MRQLSQHLLRFEPIIVFAIVYVFWFADANRMWSLLLLPLLLVIRWLAYGRLVTNTPLNWVFALLLVLGVFNVFAAPYTRGNVALTFAPLDWRVSVPWAWVMLGRPLMGMAIYFAFVEYARRYGMRSLIALTAILALIVAGLALVSSQWNSKSAQLMPIIDLLPQSRDLWIAPGGFNANEIAGGIAWLMPLCAGLALYRWRPGWLQAAVLLAFELLLLALMLGQSRLAIGGVLVALAVVSLLLFRTWRLRALALAGVALLAVFQVALMFNAFAPSADAQAGSLIIEGRDENSTAGRIEMYASVLDILNDYPLTGVGMNMYRDGNVRDLYPVPSFDPRRVLPHAHNEALQLAADFGYPGLFLYIVVHGLVLYMVWRCWRHGDRQARVVAVAVGAGLLGHGIYGMGDAVAFWDRFIFVYWWLLGLLGGQYVITTHSLPKEQGETTPQQ